MVRGGKRRGAGRKRGSLTKRTQEIAARAVEQGITPLEVMLAAMRDAWDRDDKSAAAAFAKDAAPYVHARLANVDLGSSKGPLEIKIVQFREVA